MYYFIIYESAIREREDTQIWEDWPKDKKGNQTTKIMKISFNEKSDVLNISHALFSLTLLSTNTHTHTATNHT